jgi:hypothetical protein
MAIVGLPAPIRNSIPPALPTGGRTIIELCKYVNASYLNSRQLPGLCQPTSLIGALVIGHWSLVTGHWSLVVGHWSSVFGREL